MHKYVVNESFLILKDIRQHDVLNDISVYLVDILDKPLPPRVLDLAPTGYVVGVHGLQGHWVDCQRGQNASLVLFGSVVLVYFDFVHDNHEVEGESEDFGEKFDENLAGFGDSGVDKDVAHLCLRVAADHGLCRGLLQGLLISLLRVETLNQLVEQLGLHALSRGTDQESQKSQVRQMYHNVAFVLFGLRMLQKWMREQFSH